MRPLTDNPTLVGRKITLLSAASIGWGSAAALNPISNCRRLMFIIYLLGSIST
jgi:hypothetical protein